MENAGCQDGGERVDKRAVMEQLFLSDDRLHVPSLCHTPISNIFYILVSFSCLLNHPDLRNRVQIVPAFLHTITYAQPN